MGNGYFIKVEANTYTNKLEVSITVSDSDPDGIQAINAKKGLSLSQTLEYNSCGFLRTRFGATEERFHRKCQKIIKRLSDKLDMIKRVSSSLTKTDGLSRATRRL